MSETPKPSFREYELSSQGQESVNEQAPDKALKEILNIHELPEMAFQSYELLKNNATELKTDFLGGKFRNPKLEYNEFGTPDQFENSVARLDSVASQSRDYMKEIGENGVSAVETTLGFRAAEMQLIGIFATLNEAVDNNLPADQVSEIADEARTLNEKLYGRPDPEILGSSLGHIWQNIENKNLSFSAQEIKQQLENGFSWQGEFIGGLPKPETYETLPDFDHPALAWAGEQILADTAPIEALIREIWDIKVAEHGEDYEAGPDDIAEMFSDALHLLDSDGSSGVQVEIDPSASALSWDSSTMSIKVGAKRKAIKSAEEVYKKFLHEGYIHGGRAINGSKTELPVLGTGLFTDTERADYLTFEEGLATTIEEVVSNVDPKWDSAKLGHCINIWLAEQGNDFRSTFELSWRYRLLSAIEEGQEVDEKFIAKHQSVAYASCVRIFRGTPTDLSIKYPEIKPVTYNKDIAYLNGRIIAMDYLAGLYENQDHAGLSRLISAKFDPTIPEQDQLVTQFCPNTFLE